MKVDNFILGVEQVVIVEASGRVATLPLEFGLESLWVQGMQILIVTWEDQGGSCSQSGEEIVLEVGLRDLLTVHAIDIDTVRSQEAALVRDTLPNH